MKNKIIEGYWFTPFFHRSVYLIAVILLLVGLLFSNAAVSIAVISLSVNWLIEGRIISKTKLFLKNPGAVLMVLFYLLHAVGVLWSEDIDYALKDLRIKLPLLALPVIFSSINWKEIGGIKLILSFFVTSVFVSSIVSTVVYLGYGIEVKDIRDISIFISHIRFGLMVVLAIFIILYFSLKLRSGRWIKVLLLGLAIWLTFFLFILKSLSGIVVFGVGIYVLLLKYLFSYKTGVIRIGISSLLIASPLVLLSYFYYHINQFYTIEGTEQGQMEQFSKKGNPYGFDTSNKAKENGRYVKFQIAEVELREAWNKRSTLLYDGNDKIGQRLSEVLQRFLTSKGFKKDEEGVLNLTDEEVKAIESGIANVRYMDGLSVDDRIYQVIWEIDSYLNGSNPQGNSVSMRFEFWKTGWGIFKENPVFGVGTGDIKNAFAEMYIRENTALDQKFRLRGHNQYLTIAAQLGLLGLLIFISLLVVPFIENKNGRKTLFIGFWVIAVLSMINEDTIETQMGVTFFSFFYCFLLYYLNPKVLS